MQTWAWGVCRPPTGFASHLLLLLRDYCWAQKGHRNRKASGSRSVDSVSSDTHAEVGAGGSPVSFSSRLPHEVELNHVFCVKGEQRRGKEEEVSRKYSKTE